MIQSSIRNGILIHSFFELRQIVEQVLTRDSLKVFSLALLALKALQLSFSQQLMTIQLASLDPILATLGQFTYDHPSVRHLRFGLFVSWLHDVVSALGIHRAATLKKALILLLLLSIENNIFYRCLAYILIDSSIRGSLSLEPLIKLILLRFRMLFVHYLTLSLLMDKPRVRLYCFWKTCWSIWRRYHCWMVLFYNLLPIFCLFLLECEEYSSWVLIEWLDINWITWG